MALVATQRRREGVGSAATEVVHGGGGFLQGLHKDDRRELARNLVLAR